jgi:hypothetical protein
MPPFSHAAADVMEIFAPQVRQLYVLRLIRLVPSSIWDSLIAIPSKKRPFWLISCLARQLHSCAVMTPSAVPVVSPTFLLVALFTGEPFRLGELL